MHNIDIFDEALLIKNDTTRLLVQRIVEDRKYDIPEWFFKYIDQEVLVSIIYGQDYMIIDKELITFIYECISHGVITNTRGFLISLLDNELLKYAFVLNPRVFYRNIKSFIPQIRLKDIIDIMSNWIKFNKDEPVPKQYIKLYIRVFRYTHKIKVDDIFPIHYSIIDTYLLPEIYQLHGSRGTDCVFSTIWDMYCSKNSDDYDMYHNRCSLVWYWESFNGNFLPNNASIKDIERYMETKIDSTDTKLNPKVNLLMKKILKRAPMDNVIHSINNRISTNVISAVVKNIDNIDLVYWTPDIMEVNMFMTLFSKHPESLSNYEKLYGVTKKLPKPDDIIKYIQAGNDYFSIKKYAEKVSQLDPELYVETICLYTDNDTLTKILLDKSSSSILKIHMTLFEFIMKKYVDKNTDVRIKDRLATIILNNPEFYKSKLLSQDRLLSLLDMNNHSLKTIAINYPNTFTYLPNMYHSYYIIKDIISTQYNLIYYVPWNKLTKDDIVNEIRLNGYFPVMSEFKEKDNMINEFINGEEIYMLISDGYGFGYILEYGLSEYLKILLSTAIKYIETHK